MKEGTVMHFSREIQLVQGRVDVFPRRGLDLQRRAHNSHSWQLAKDVGDHGS